jgi:hypothetical protein
MNITSEDLKEIFYFAHTKLNIIYFYERDEKNLIRLIFEGLEEGIEELLAKKKHDG